MSSPAISSTATLAADFAISVEGIEPAAAAAEPAAELAAAGSI